MSLVSIAREALESEQVRRVIGESGKRIFRSNPEQPKQDEGGGLLGWIWDFGKQIVGLISNVFKFVAFTATAIWGLIVGTTQYIWNFDWNMSDDSIDQQILSSWAALSGMFGGLLGNAFGYLACGVLPGAVVFTFNEPLGAYILKNVSEEMAEEFVGNLTNVIRYTLMSSVQSLLLWSFKNIRKWIKTDASLIYEFFGDAAAAELLRAWAEPDSKPWSFASATESAVQSIPNVNLRNFVEEFLEEAWEGCVEAGYVVANSIDTFLAEEKLKRQEVPPLGDQKYVEIQPDRSNERERIILAGPEEALKPVIVQTLSNFQLMENKDIGTFVGSPIDDYLRAKPQSIRLVIQFFNVPSPPWTPPGDQRLVSATYAIPDVDPVKIDWEKIKIACGHPNGYLWGRWRATGLLNNGRQMQVMGATKDEAEDRLKALLALSKAELLKKPSITEDRGEDETGSFLKQPTRVYPAYFTIMNQYKVPGALGSGVPLSSGNYIRKHDRINLWTETEPEDFSDRILELLRRPGAEDNQNNNN